MSNIWDSLNVMIEIALMMGVGFVLRKARFLSDSLQSGCTEFLTKIAVPAVVLSSAFSVSFTPETIRGSAMVLLISALGYAINGAMGFIAGRALGFNADERVAATGAMMFRNVVFMGYPVCSALLGAGSIFYAAISSVIFNALMFSFGVSLYSQGRAKGLAQLAKNPALICSAAMILMLALQIRLPIIVEKAISGFAGVSTPVSLVIIGMILADGDLAAVLKKRATWIASGLSLIIYPLIVLILVLLLKPGGMAGAVLLTQAVLPAGTLNVILAKEYGSAGEVSSQVVLHTMLASLVVIPLFLPLLLSAAGFAG